VADRTPVDAGAPGDDALEGLTRRVRRADAAAAGPSNVPVRASQRSPEEVRQMLSRYRSGLQRGRTDDGPTESSRP